MKDYAIIIPALNPTEILIDYVKILLTKGAAQIIVVNDGSLEVLANIFNELKTIEGCTVLTHEKNSGKGRALKTAFNYFQKYHQDLEGVITAVADGQHSIKDVCKVAKALMYRKEDIILGVRRFKESSVPLRSYLGNTITSLIFRLLYGYNITDTQTGLRGIPKNKIPWILELRGEGYEFEMNMLIYAKKMKTNIREIAIQTIYINNNASSHYKPIKDSIKVFMMLITGFIHYFYSTILSVIVDVSSFILLHNVLLVGMATSPQIFLSTFISRILSSTFNFYMNRKIVFESETNIKTSLIRYYILCLGLIVASYLLTYLAHTIIGINVVIAKFCCDIILGVLSYQVQLKWVFKNKKVGNGQSL